MIRNVRIVIVFILAIVASGCGASAARYNNAGNSNYESEKFGEAIENYVAAQREDPDLPEPYYNAGNAFHRQGNFEAAAAQEQQAIRGSEGELTQNSFYNLGNTYFKVEDWQAAIEAYKEALKIKPDDEEAKYNLELALKKLEDQQQQQQQQEQGGGSGQSEEEQSEGGGQQDQEQDQNQGQGENEQEEQGGGGQPEQDEDGESGSDPQDNQSQSGPRGLTPQEAQQLLDALGQDSQTLQERLQQEFFAPGLPPSKDW
jgi:tetratricopeptide (TPR) repeat protein